MKRAFPLFMAAALLLQSAAGALVFMLQLRHHQHEQWERVEASIECETLHISRDAARREVHWENHKEFYWQGQMWDVKAVKATRTGWEVQALPDAEEKEMKHAFARQTEAGNRASLPGKVKTLFLLSLLPVDALHCASPDVRQPLQAADESLPPVPLRGPDEKPPQS